MQVQYKGFGKVRYAEKEYECKLYYSEKEGGIIIVLTVKNKNRIGDFFELPLGIPFLSGQLESGFKFTLLQLFRKETKNLFSYGITEFTFSAKYIICGFEEESQSEPSFRKVNYTLSNIVEWGEETVYSIGENHELYRREEVIKKCIYDGQEYKINYIVSGSMLPVVISDLLKESIELKQSGIIEVEFQNQAPFNRFNEVFEKIKRLIEISVLRKLNVERVCAYKDEVVYSFGDKSIKRPLDVYGENITDSELSEYDISSRWKWISLSELINQNSFIHYFCKHEKLAPIIELFLEPMYIIGVSTTRVFLNVVQSLETYHSRFVTSNLEEFKSRIDNYVRQLPPDQAESIRTFLMANSRGFITLESRLADLLYADRCICFDTGEIELADFPSVISHTRNYYIHYDEKIKENHRVLTEEELQIYNRALFQILEYYVLLGFGFSNESGEIKEKITKRWGRISQDIEVLKTARLQHNIT